VQSSIELDDGCVCVRMSPTDPGVVFVGGNGGLLLKYNTATSARTPLQGHQKTVWGLCVSEDGSTVASGSEDQTVWLWDTTTGCCLWTSSKQIDWIFSVAMFGEMVFCGVQNSSTVGLRLSDGTHDSKMSLASAHGAPRGLAVIRGEVVCKRARRGHEHDDSRG
jgi:WD40 repeat protein